MIIVTAYYITHNSNDRGDRILYNAKVEELSEIREYLKRINNTEKIDLEYKTIKS